MTGSINSTTYVSPTPPPKQNRQHMADQAAINETNQSGLATSNNVMQIGYGQIARDIGLMMLGGQGQLQEWESKGLSITEDTIAAAFDVFNQGMQERLMAEARGEDVGNTIFWNRHQIIENNQSVPDWFLAEKTSELNAIQDQETREAFLSGATYQHGDGESKKAGIPTPSRYLNFQV